MALGSPGAAVVPGNNVSSVLRLQLPWGWGSSGLELLLGPPLPAAAGLALTMAQGGAGFGGRTTPANACGALTVCQALS